MAGNEPRHIFISLKGRSSNGDVLFGASIMRTKDDPSYIPNKIETKAHFDTADSRLRKCPVQIVDKIFERHGGFLNIRGQRI